MNRCIHRIAALAALLLATPALASNDGDPATQDIPAVVPYDGVLDLDGASFNGQVDMIFTLYGSADGDDPVWQETWSTADERPITVTAGRFSVNLGTFEDIEDVIADAGQVFLGLSVKRPEDEEYTALAGRQRLNPVPYALWGARASNLTVAGAASVGGALTVGGQVTAANVEVDGTVRADRFFIEGVDDQQGRLFSHFGDYLYMGEQDTFGLGLRIEMPVLARFGADLRNGVSVLGGLDVDGGLTLTDGATITGAVGITGSVTLTGGLSATTDIDAGDAFRLDDGAGFTNALRAGDNYLRLGDSGRFNNGLLVLNPTRFDEAVDMQADLDVTGGVGVGGDADVEGNLRVGGAVNLEDCRICISFSNENQGGNQTHACVRLVANSHSGFRTFRQTGELDDDDEFSLAFVCDGGGNSTGADIIEVAEVAADPNNPEP